MHGDPNQSPTPGAAWDDIPDDFFVFSSPPSSSPTAGVSPSSAPAGISPSVPAGASPSPAPAGASPSSASTGIGAPRAADRSATAADHWPPPPGPHHSSSLPEFAPRTATGTIGPSPCDPLSPGFPPPFDLRPRPLRESQAGSALCAIASDGARLWAAGESGVRAWDLADAFVAPPAGVKWGDEAAAPFVESHQMPAAACLAVDSGRGIVWSGHGNGQIMGWRAPPCRVPERSRRSSVGGAAEGDGLVECLAWNAHRGAVLSIVVTPYGDLWSGSEKGAINVWPKDEIDKSLNLIKEAKHKALLVIERSCIDLRAVVSSGGDCPLPTVDTNLMLSDNHRLKVWSGGYLSFSFWDSCTKELLKVITLDGQVETRFDALSLDAQFEFDRKLPLKKEKSLSPVGFFQRSRNALMGAADVVRRAAAKAGFADDTHRVEALSMSADGMIWTGSANGSISQWDGNGNRLQQFQHHSSSVQCICSYGRRLWVGYADGSLQLLDLEGKLLGGWVAHEDPLLGMGVAGAYIFVLSNHGGIRGWSLTCPGPLDNMLRMELVQMESKFENFEYLKVMVASWNVGQERASPDSIKCWLEPPTPEIGIVVVGLQEVDMGAGFLAMATAKESVGLEGNPAGEWWIDAIGQQLKRSCFELAGSRQLAGLLIAVWVKTDLRHYIGDVDLAAVPCGFGRAIGNKGAVALRMRIFGRSVCFVSCHFAAHLEAVNQRNDDFDHVFQTLTFNSPSGGLAASVGASAAHILRGSNVTLNRKSELSEADMVVFFGDFNYRIYGIPYEEVMRLIAKDCLSLLKENDQLRAEMKAGRVFQGFREGTFRFPPTYKFEKHVRGLSGYDASEKKRIPAWCDRILYRDSRSNSDGQCSLHCPVVSSISLYDSCMEVTDSDHKPVKCIFNIDVACLDELTRRLEFGRIMASNKNVKHVLDGLLVIPEISVSTDSIVLQDQLVTSLKLTNQSTKYVAVYEIVGRDSSGEQEQEQSQSSGGFGSWLKVFPMAGVIHPGRTTDISVQLNGLHDRRFSTGSSPSASARNRDIQDRSATLTLHVRGQYSTDARLYGPIRVRHHSSFSKR